VTRNALDRPSIVIRNFGRSGGEIMASVDLTQVDAARVFDFRSPVVRDTFLARYPSSAARSTGWGARALSLYERYSG